MQIGLSAVVQKRVKNKELKPLEDQDLAFCWDTHLIKHRNRNVLLVVNVSSRYTIAMTDIEPRNWNYYEVYMGNVIRFAMKEEGYTDEQIRMYFQMAGQTMLTKTHGKKAVGGINRVMAAMEVYDDPLIKDVKYQADLCEFLNRDICTPVGYDAYGYPVEFFQLDMERLGIGTKRKPAKIIEQITDVHVGRNIE